MPELGDLKLVDIRELWSNKARDFTPWLAENIGSWPKVAKNLICMQS
jgi:hypothetical protein